MQHRALRHVSWRLRQAHVDLPTASTGAAAAGRRRCRGVFSTREKNWNLTKDGLAAVLKATGELPQAALDQLLERVGDNRLAAEDALQARLTRGRALGVPRHVELVELQGASKEEVEELLLVESKLEPLVVLDDVRRAVGAELAHVDLPYRVRHFAPSLARNVDKSRESFSLFCAIATVTIMIITWSTRERGNDDGEMAREWMSLLRFNESGGGNYL